MPTTYNIQPLPLRPRRPGSHKDIGSRLLFEVQILKLEPSWSRTDPYNYSQDSRHDCKERIQKKMTDSLAILLILPVVVVFIDFVTHHHAPFKKMTDSPYIGGPMCEGLQSGHEVGKILELFGDPYRFCHASCISGTQVGNEVPWIIQMYTNLFICNSIGRSHF
jgi:hypothetical protein